MIEGEGVIGPEPMGVLPSDAVSDASNKAGPPPSNRLRGLAMAAGSAGLLCAMATDALSVAGRHFGFTILGAIEIFEASIVIAATAAIVIATLDSGHARVRILLERVRPAAALGLDRVADGLAVLIFIAVAAGSAWLLTDLWNGHEMTEVLGLPLRWFRLIWILGCAICVALSAKRFLAGRS